MSDQEVVIVDDQGQEHIFPPGFDPKKAAGIVKASSAPKAPTHRGDTYKGPDSYWGGFWNSLKKDASGLAGAAADWAPTIGGAAGGILGGLAGAAGGFGVGAAPGAIGGASAGGALGKVVQNAANAALGRGSGYDRPIDTPMVSLRDIAGEGALQGGYEALGQGAGAVLGKAGSAMYRKLLQPSITERLAPRAADTVATGLQERINPFSAKHLQYVKDTIEDLNSQVENAVRDQSKIVRATANPKDVEQRVVKQAAKFAGSGADPADRAAIARVRQGFLEDQTQMAPKQVQKMMPGPFGGNPRLQTVTELVPELQPMTPVDILKARRSTGASAGSKAFGNAGVGADIAGRKELYHELGTELGDMVPSVKPVMNRESRLIDLKDAAMAASDKAANAKFVSLSKLAPAGAAAGSLLYDHDPTTAAERAAVAYMMFNPRVLAQLAIESARLGARPRTLAAGGRLFGDTMRNLLGGPSYDYSVEP